MAMRNGNYVVIGGSGIDVAGFSHQAILLRDSNPGSIRKSPGGVARNIAENMTHLGLGALLFTALGEDNEGDQVILHSRDQGIDMSHVLRLSNVGTSAYLTILDCNGEMIVALADMDAIDYVDEKYLKQFETLLAKSQAIVIDANLSPAALEYLFLHYGAEKALFVDPVSAAKVNKLEPYLPYIHTFKPNRLEAEVLLGYPIKEAVDYEGAIKTLRKRGIQNVVISDGANGVYYGNGFVQGYLPSLPAAVVNATGAGDAFMAGLVYGYHNHLELQRSCQIAIISATLTIQNEETINPDLCAAQLQQKMKEIYHEVF